MISEFDHLISSLYGSFRDLDLSQSLTGIFNLFYLHLPLTFLYWDLNVTYKLYY
jgi:hypothetical protein